MQASPSYRTNRDLFANHYLDELLPETDVWNAIDDSVIEDRYEDIRRIYDEQRPHVEGLNEAPLEEEFIKPVLDALGHTYAVQEEVKDVRRYPDYAFFADEKAKTHAYNRQDAGDADFYRDAVAVGDAKRWGRKLDKLSGERRNFSNPSHQIYVYLQETPADWAILTNGKQWRLYYAETSHKLDSYYEVDLEALLETDEYGLNDFKYFYNFFRSGAFVAGGSRESFLDRVYDRSAVFAQELGEDLQNNIYEAIRLLAEGFLQYPDNDLDPEADLGLVHDSSLVYLYRLIFVFYAESEGRDLLDTQKKVYDQQYSLNTLKREVREELESASPKYKTWSDDLWDRLEELFELIDRGSESRGIPREDLYVPAYNGGLFRTEVDAETSREVRFLQEHKAGDSYVARAVDLLARRETDADGGTGFVDYSSLDIRHLGSIYEGLLEYELNVADEPLDIEDGEYVPAEGSETADIEASAVYLTTDRGERKATGSYYTPEYVVQYIVENTLDPLLDDIREDLLATREENFAEEFAERVFDLKILDPAMGSGHFLTNAVDHLANEIVDAQQKQGEEAGEATIDESHDIHWARRQVVQRCLYGVDLNPLAVELAKVSLWLRTLAAEQPLAFLDHHLKTGNSLVGSNIKDIDELETDANGGPNASLAEFGATRRGTIDHLMDIYEGFIAIENTDLADAKEMERKYREIERDDLRNRLVAMANVKTAADFDLDLPSGAYERMAGALDSEEEWADVAATDWFQSAQAMAAERNFLHWKLEFPEVFYEVDGSDQENPGFDAVIGNPPYLGTKHLSVDERQYLKKNFQSTTDKWDVYCLFTEQGLHLSAECVSYVQPAMFMRRPYGRGLRSFITKNTQVAEIVNMSDIEVFEDATNYVCIPLLRMDTEVDDFRVLTPKHYHEIGDRKKNADSYVLSNSELTEESWPIIPPSVVQIMDSIPEEFVTLSSITETISEGIKTGMNDVFLFTESEANDLSLEVDLMKPLLKGKDIQRYEPPLTDFLCIYPYENNEPLSEEQLRTAYPNIWAYLTENRDRLEERPSVGPSKRRWYELERQREGKIYENPKILVPDISDHNKFTVDTDVKNYFNTKVKSIQLSSFLNTYTTLAVLNSSLMEFIYRGIAPPKRGGFRAYKPILLSELELPDYTVPELGEKSEALIAYREQKNALNLSLPDYLGNYADGPTLGELYQPPAGVADSILTDTTEKREKLKLEDITVADESPKLVVRATARYKPENPEAFETDRWEYTETEPMPAMEFVGLSDAERGLIRAFVPHAVSEGEGFAGFRKNSTPNNSLVDRLEALTLPALADVEDGLERYRQATERAAELDEKIEKTDELIDQIVYRLYGLTDEEIEIVEETVGE